MTRHTRTHGLIIAIVCAAAGCAAPGYNPPERPVARDCPASEVWVCEDRYPSRLENENEAPMICRCEDIHHIH